MGMLFQKTKQNKTKQNKKVQTSQVWRHNDVIIAVFPQIVDLQWIQL